MQSVSEPQAPTTLPTPSAPVPSSRSGIARGLGGPFLAESLAVSCFLAGALLRYLYIFHWHPAKDYLFSDMKGYLQNAQNFLNPAYIPNFEDTVFPPGTGWYLGITLYVDPSWGLFHALQLLLSILIPIVLAGLAYDLYGRRVALGVLGMASLYFPFMDYAGYVLAETPLTFFFSAGMWLMVRSLKAQGPRGALGFAAGSGLSFGLACIFKSSAIACGGLTAAVLGLMAWKHRLPLGKRYLAAAAGIVLVLVPVSIRNTKASEGRFCLVANQTGVNFLLGKRGPVFICKFFDPKRGLNFEFGSPSATQRGYRKEEEFQIGVYEDAELMRVGWEWTKEHPGEAFLGSLEHVSDLFFFVRPWPSCEVEPLKPWVRLFQFVFLGLVLMPAVIYLGSKGLDLLRLAPTAWSEALLITPLVAMMLVAFLFIGEPRHRIPFDGLLMILAARLFWGSLKEDRTWSA